ncbi:aminodeoxychorismate lyase [Thioflavicoccus mobilis 8321]|uniref:Aminodeoxychorismate lyase n=1 Tax=Thioflavicoccus mobilis 8321 TaxID=765912 RepID=L0GWI3_9GAMM|nr:aminodeoxychorismate lyase [Thioflavicoccus mobilis]AGA91113.1 aminodeoxychorismate lyase [Thioflavicoccus mobilis 8321]
MTGLGSGGPAVGPGPLRSLIDGVPADRIPVGDRGIHYGDGLFETINLRGGRPCLWGLHVTRLHEGAARLDLPLPEIEVLHRECLALADGAPDGVLKLILTRGDGGRGYRPPAVPQPRRILALYARPDHPRAWLDTGVAVLLCRTPAGQSPALAGLKHLNRLEQVLARAEWDDPQIAEGLMVGSDGHLVGGTMSNLFLLRGRRLVTPRLDRAGVAGTVRAALKRLAPGLGYEMVEARLRPEDLSGADGAFLTNAVIGLWAIRRCAGRDLGYEPLPAALVAAVRGVANDPDWS